MGSGSAGNVDSEGSEFLVNDDGDSKVILPKAN
jgi:hypothetical protein